MPLFARGNDLKNNPLTFSPGNLLNIFYQLAKFEAAIKKYFEISLLQVFNVPIRKGQKLKNKI